MEFMTKPQQKELNKRAVYFSNDQSKDKGVFPKRHFTPKDIVKLLKNRNRIKHTLLSLVKSKKIIQNHDYSKHSQKRITEEQFIELNDYIMNTLKMDSWGVATFEEKEIFKGDGIPYNKVIVLSKHMKDDHFVVKELPNMDCMLEVMEVYGDTGVACLKLTKYLRTWNFGAIPNHSLGGNIDYTKAGYKANLGFIGKHGMLITPHNGPCNRLSIVYTNIENLEEFLEKKEDYSWGKEFCATCKRCVKSCPYQAIYEESKIDENGHVECISYLKCGSGFAEYGCAICIAACPFTKVGYHKIKSSFLKK